jgi:DNA-binding XRE family transcriptional regulator
MSSNPLQGHPDGGALRKQAGAFLRKARMEAGVTQMELAVAMGATYYTVISQIEAGKARLPPDKTMAVAQKLGWQPAAFYKRLLQWYDPYGWDCLYGPNAEKGERER